MDEQQVSIYEDARTMANIATWGVELQTRRIRNSIQEDKNEIEEFVMQPIIDFHFLVTALSRLRLTAELVSEICDLSSAIEDFDKNLPDLRAVRNILEHIDEYRVGKGHNKNVPKVSFQTFTLDDDSIKWLNYEINLEQAIKASGDLFMAIKSKSPNPAVNTDATL
jgi:hypothetical protein